MSDNQKPLFTIRDGAIKVTVWENRTNDGNTFHSVSFGRTFTNGEAIVKSTNSFSGSDVLKAARLAERAYDRIADIRQETALQSQHREAA